MRRTISRIRVLCELYQYDLMKGYDLTDHQNNIENFDKLLLEIDDFNTDYDHKFANNLFNGIIDKIASVDHMIALCLEKYPFDRLSYVDRSLLRIGTYEMMYTTTPHSIIINEIINLSKEYSQDDNQKTSRFNNSVLDSVSKKIKEKGINNG